MILALLLAASAPPAPPATRVMAYDGGITLPVYCSNCSGGGGAGGTVYIADAGPPLNVQGAFWQATQPVSLASVPAHGLTGQVAINIMDAGAPMNVQGAFFQATQPVSLASVPTHGVTGTFWQATQPVSGTFWQATQPVSIASMPSTPVTGTFFQATQPVSLTSTTITGTVAATQSGTWTDRVVGNAGGAFDSANNAAAPANVIADGFEAATMTVTQPAAATAGNMRRAVVGTDGVLYMRSGGPVQWSCFVQAVTVMTQCRAAPAAGLRAYVTSITCSNQAATVQGIDVVFGTGTNCATVPTALTHKIQFGTNATTTSPFVFMHTFATPLIPTAANAICVRPTAATAFGCTLTGYDAP